MKEPPKPELVAAAPASAASDPFAALGASPVVAAADAPKTETRKKQPEKKATRQSQVAKAKSTETRKGDRTGSDKPTALASANATSAKPGKAAARSSSNKDPDVDLLAALMAHVATTGAQNGGTGAQTVSVVSSGTSSREPAKSLDEPTIATLVKRCESLGAEESRECRRRICDGYWGKAQACPSKLAPRRS